MSKSSMPSRSASEFPVWPAGAEFWRSKRPRLIGGHARPSLGAPSDFCPSTVSKLFEGMGSWDALGDFATAATTERFAAFFESSDNKKRARWLNYDDVGLMQETSAAFILEHGKNISNIASLSQKLAGMTACLTDATAPLDMSVAAKQIHCNLTAWMYLVDDGVGLWAARDEEKDDYSNWIRSLVDYQWNCWSVGVRGGTCPQAEPIFPDSLCRNEESLKRALPLFSLGAALYRCATDLRLLCRRSMSHLSLEEEVHYLGRELYRSLQAKVLEAMGAPQTREGYLQRHSRTGHVRVCLELNLLLYGWQQGSRRSDLEALDKGLLHRAIENTDHAVLRSNELCFVKDIAEPEESLVAVTIASLLENDLDVQQWLKTSCGHGEILRQFVGTPVGFNALKIVLEELCFDFHELVMTCEQLERSPLSPLAGTVVVRTYLSWAFGYHFINPALQRYSTSFNSLLAVMKDSEPDFIAEVSKYTKN